MLKKTSRVRQRPHPLSGRTFGIDWLDCLTFHEPGTPAKVIFLFSASATYHMVQVKAKALEIFRKVDHAAIYCLMAGTYTPFCVLAFSGFWKWAC